MSCYGLQIQYMPNIDLYIQKTQNLGIGSCVDKPDDFCTEKVANSVCNRVKDQCFCKRGYVIIKEEEGVTCKPLLTNLKCRTDLECIHINKSTCHPGAGLCTCPGNTVYNSEIHACRIRYDGQQTQFCETCNRMGGTCFVYESYDNTTISQKINGLSIGCSCSYNRGTNKDKYKNYADLCQVIFSDVGEFCDQQKYRCQSRVAKCINKYRKSDSQRICSCPRGFIPVYQVHLQYYECYKKLTSSRAHCLNCNNAGGECYDMNNDQVGDGCLCPSRLATENTNIDFRLNKQLCRINTVHESCSNGYLSICYQPHSEPPFEYLLQNLRSNISVVRLPGSITNLRSSTSYLSIKKDQCVLQGIYESSDRDKYRFCIRVDVLNPTKNCGVQYYRLKHNKVLYQTTLIVQLDKSIRQPSTDLRIPVSCISDSFTRKFKNVTKKSQIVTKKPNVMVMNLGLQIVDKYNKEVLSLVEGSEAKLDVSLVDSAGIYRSIRVEECYSSNYSTSIGSSKFSESEKIIYKGCPVYKNSFFASFKTEVSPGIHLQSDPFQIYRYGELRSVFYKCLIKVCRDSIDCKSIMCRPYDTPNVIQPKDQSETKILERWSHVEVEKLQGYRNTHSNGDTTVCHHVVCLSASQTVLIALLLFFLLIMVIVLLIFYSRGKSIPTHPQSLLLSSNHHPETLTRLDSNMTQTPGAQSSISSSTNYPNHNSTYLSNINQGTTDSPTLLEHQTLKYNPHSQHYIYGNFQHTLNKPDNLNYISVTPNLPHILQHTPTIPQHRNTIDLQANQFARTDSLPDITTNNQSTIENTSTQNPPPLPQPRNIIYSLSNFPSSTNTTTTNATPQTYEPLYFNIQSNIQSKTLTRPTKQNLHDYNNNKHNTNSLHKSKPHTTPVPNVNHPAGCSNISNINNTNIKSDDKANCSCGSKECEYQPFINTTKASIAL